ncbi:LysR family transcriptional regulator [Sulfitobacter albidus]|uniref:LysR family transcriptional regulator n=1 Tax=Sulfitobacter albidus TaxID=2829501 RepID=A0A975JCZ2_9RHOB|nr:LysR family transcriptional regulator [Sulfitobacter albidus]QUJ75810.1 LysR family transcriptional regulator [Sulfitobacter albidus]
MLNFHHLRYFHAVAHEGHLTRAAERMNLSQSALSAQIRALEDRLGHALFDRVGRRLQLTEVGRIVLDHADRIFDTGAELEAVLAQTGDAVPPLRVGALSTLSRNFQLQFLRPALGRCEVILKSGGAGMLLEMLEALGLDVVLSTAPPDVATAGRFTTHAIAAQPVGLHGAPARLAHDSLRDLLSTEPLILPTGAIRIGFDSLLARLGVTPTIAAEVDDMAMVRLLAREDAGVALAPDVVLADEIASGRIATAPFDLDLTERFYAITVPRGFPHPLLAELTTPAYPD